MFTEAPATPPKRNLKLLIWPVDAVPKSIGTLRASTGACAELWLAVGYLLPDVYGSSHVETDCV